MFKGSILTKNNLLKKGWTGSEKCRFCSANKTIDHLFLHWSLDRYAWGVIKCVFVIDMNVDSVQDLCGWMNSLGKLGAW